MWRKSLLRMALVCCLGGVSVFAQTPDPAQPQDVGQLQEKVQQLGQLTQELKARLAQLEKSQPGTPRVVNTTVPADGSPPATMQPKEPSSLAAAPQDAPPQPAPPEEKVAKPEIEVYGHAMLDLGYDANQINPNWFDVERPTQLPSFPNEFGQDGRLFAGVRQTRFGVKSLFPTQIGRASCRERV